MTTAPPVIPGYEHVRHLGTGGCATVWHYRERTEQMERDVAIKVLHDLGMGDVSRRLFLGEVRAMARLGSHPNIVQVFRADATPAGEPYIVMQFYPNSDLASIARARPFSVAEALEIGVRLAGAVETAHDAGILHRDIKPANVLADEFGQPGLTDFGIAGRIATIGQDDSGLSVPWAAPEVVRGGTASIVTDVYSLAATVWQLLVGRSPFSDPLGRNDSVDAITHRVLTTSAPPTGRRDVPRSLELALADGLAKNPADRPPTAADLARRLQDVERDLGLSVTRIVVRRQADSTTVTPAPSSRPEGHTRLSAPPRVDTVRRLRSPGPHPGQSTPGQPVPGQPSSGQSTPGPFVRPVTPGPPAPMQPAPLREPARPAAQPAAATALREVAPAPEPVVVPPPQRRLPLVLAGAAAVVVAVVVGVVIMTSGPPNQGAAGEQPTVTRDVGVQDAGVPGVNVPPGVPTITPERLDDATVRFTWTYSARLDSDTFAWRIQDGAAGTAATATVDLPVPVGEATCLQVKVVRADGGNATTDWSPAGCSG